MPTCCCLIPFQQKIAKLGTEAAIRREHAKLPESCMDSRCSPGGCKRNCRDYAAGAIVKLNRQGRR